MRRRLSIFLSIFTLAVSLPARGDTDTEVKARKAALDVAGAFTNDGFKMRDGHWCGTIKPHEHALIAVNLYAGIFHAGQNRNQGKINLFVNL